MIIEEHSKYSLVKHPVVGILLILLLSCAAGYLATLSRERGGHQPQHSEIHTEAADHHRNELKYVSSAEIFETSSRYTFCDTRTAVDYEREHIKESVHCQSLDKLVSNKPIVFYGQSRLTKPEKRVVLQLMSQANKGAYILSDGIDGWKRISRDVERKAN
ncbi:MAG: hypothetical protein JWQ02_1334 [Capsulimonas sp.]|nr:hypothetical protein [Capsulimonas sp.]